MERAVGLSTPDTNRGAEQRREPREAAGGIVRFSFRETGSKLALRKVRGQLVDRSAGGFRAEHDCSELTSGQVVRFRIGASARGQARVVWTRIQEDRVETGFVILA